MFRDGNSRGAFEQYTTALKLDPGDAQTHRRLAQLLTSSKDPQFHDPRTALSEARLACRLSNYKNRDIMAVLAPEDLPMLYRIWDCLLHLSGGEGFGLPAWEAMCAALPVVYTNYSAHGEFLRRGKAGLPVSGILQPEPKTCIWRMVADVPQAIEAVRRLYFDRKLARELGANGRRFADGFGIQTQVDAWHATFERLVRAPVPPLCPSVGLSANAAGLHSLWR